jgi:hypothetical protein
MRVASFGARVLALVGLAVMASGCLWRVPGATPDRQGYNRYENTVTPDNVAGLTLAWSAATDATDVGDPVTSNAGVHVADLRSAYGFDTADGHRLWAEASAAPLVMDAPHVRGGDTVLVGRWNPTATATTDPDGSDRTLQLDAATGATVAEPHDGVIVALRGERAAYSSIDFVRLGFARYPFWLTTVDLDPPCCGYWYYLSQGAEPATPLPPVRITLGTAEFFQAGDGLLSPTELGQTGNGLRAYRPSEAQSCSGYLCPTWLVPLDGTTATPVVLADGEGVAYTGTDAGTVYAVDTGSHEVLWTAAVGAAVADSPALAGGSLYVPTVGGGLAVLDAATGDLLWTAAPGSTLVAQPAVGGGVVYTAASGGALAAYDAAGCGAATCTPLWSATTGSEVTGGPAIDAGQLYVGTADGHLDAYRAA